MNWNQSVKVAIVCDWIQDMWWAELVLEHLLELFPQADIFTSVFHQPNHPLFKNRKIYTSFIQKLPFFSARPKLSLFFRPFAFKRFRFDWYDLVISSSSAESKGVIVPPKTLHICYCHTPTRYFWSHYTEYKNMLEFGFLNPLAKLCMVLCIPYLKKLDFLAAKRPDFFIANSKNIQNRISKYYQRESEVIYPGIDTKKFVFCEQKEDYYISMGRVIPYKKFDLLVEAFNANGKKLVLCTRTDNALYRTLQAKSNANIIWRFNAPNNEIQTLLSKAKAFIFPPEEDFGLVPLEAMACGTPVIAYKKGGAIETVTENETGIFFEAQTAESVNEAMERFETLTFDPQKIRKHAEKFDKEIFKKQMLDFIQAKL